MAKAPHHSGSYDTQALRVRAAAYANPETKCWRCSLTLAEARLRWGDHIKWTAGHLVDGQVGGQLAAEHSRCNYQDGARLRHGRKPKRTDRGWD